jgi:hypothetical protein
MKPLREHVRLAGGVEPAICEEALGIEEADGWVAILEGGEEVALALCPTSLSRAPIASNAGVFYLLAGLIAGLRRC